MGHRPLDQPITVRDLALRAHLATRTFARLFRDSTGTTPHRWLTGQRLALAEQLLETSDLTIAGVARRAGFGSVDTMRMHFARRLGTTPTHYRRTFAVRG